jgi:alpha 1,2-mannosyltransferase
MIALSTMIPLQRILFPLILFALMTIAIFRRHEIQSSHIGRYVPLVFSPQKPLTDSLKTPELISFWKELENILVRARPKAAPIQPFRAPTQKELEEKPESARRLNLINIKEEDLNAMKASHGLMVRDLDELAAVLPFQPRSRGVVMSAGGNYFGMAITAIRMLRRSGSELPVEIFIDTRDDYDEDLCDEILPLLNAKCLVMDDVWSAAGSKPFFHKYQFKVFALLFSSFEDILFLDADAFAAFSPDSLFDTEPYLTTGLVTWPDFWISTTSKHFYHIAGIDETSLTVRRCGESGIMLYSKRLHAQSLLLAAYYNYYGPSYYYPLLSQGAQGEGDKETFLHAALALGKPFYDVKTPVGVMGSWRNGQFRSAGMKQADPVEDWNIREKWFHLHQYGNVSPAIMAHGSIEDPIDTNKRENQARPFFIHNNIIKLDVKRLFDDVAQYQDQGGNFVRTWGPKELVIADFGYDAEKVLWEELVIAACDIGGAVCEKAKEYYRAVFMIEESEERRAGNTRRTRNGSYSPNQCPTANWFLIICLRLSSRGRMVVRLLPW